MPAPVKSKRLVLFQFLGMFLASTLAGWLTSLLGAPAGIAVRQVAAVSVFTFCATCRALAKS